MLCPEEEYTILCKESNRNGICKWARKGNYKKKQENNEEPITQKVYSADVNKSLDVSRSYIAIYLVNFLVDCAKWRIMRKGSEDQLFLLHNGYASRRPIENRRTKYFEVSPIKNGT